MKAECCAMSAGPAVRGIPPESELVVTPVITAVVDAGSSLTLESAAVPGSLVAAEVGLIRLHQLRI